MLIHHVGISPMKSVKHLNCTLPHIDWQRIHGNAAPVLLKNLVRHWPAVSDNCRSWTNKERFKNISTDCLVPVELGRNYMDSDLNVAHVEFAEFMKYVLTSTEVDLPTEGRVYLAQYSINDIPSLMEDLHPLPKILNTGKDTLYRSNIWISGAAGSESPCHQDPFHNVLCQVFGRKRVLLFPPNEGVNLYPAHGTTQKNTSLVDFTTPDFQRHPLFTKALESCEEAVLESGDGLYIPLGWWHYCSSKGSHCSVNFWWL